MRMPRISLPKLPKIPKPGIRTSLDAVLGHGEAVFNELRHAARTHATQHPYTVDTIRSFAQLAGSGMTLWLIHRRARAAFAVSAATTAITAGLSFAQPARRAKPAEFAWNNLGNVLSTVVLALPGSRAELGSALDLSPRDPLLPFTRGEQVRNLVSLYAAYTMVGHWLEMLFCQLIKWGIVDGEYDRSNTMLWDWWLHPFPAEGIAGVLIALFLEPLRRHLLVLTEGRVLPALAASFLANQVVCTSIDYLTGMVANRNYELWDYRNMPFNFQGQICLQNSIVYTLAATLVTWVAYPSRDTWLRTVPSDAANLAFWGTIPVYAYLCLLYFIEQPIPELLRQLKQQALQGRQEPEAQPA